MARPTPIPSALIDGTNRLDGGKPTGILYSIVLPAPTYTAISDAAAKRGMTMAQALAVAINEFCKQTP